MGFSVTSLITVLALETTLLSLVRQNLDIASIVLDHRDENGKVKTGPKNFMGGRPRSANVALDAFTRTGYLSQSKTGDKAELRL